MDEIKEYTGEIIGIHTGTIVLEEPFLDFAARFASMPGTVVLMSGGNLDCSRYHILGAKPWLTFSGRNNNVSVSAGDKTFELNADPFAMLRKIIETFRLKDFDSVSSSLPVPVAAGLLGYLAYDLKDSLEKLPRTSVDDLGLPHICLFAPSFIVVYDKTAESTFLCIPERILAGQSTLESDLDAFHKIYAQKPPEQGDFRGETRGFKSDFEKPDYIDAIEKIKEYIASGHVYQVNMSQRFEMGFQGDTFNLFRSLYRKNPAPFFAYVHAGTHQVVSTSPERFLLQTGRRVETRPIKGTRPRGRTPAEDHYLRRELEQSEKDDAELSMIVDLLRNDLGKVCAAGSVRVVGHKQLEAYENVYHLVSVVEGTLEKDRDSVDILRATFPGGSITGCPKIRSMEIIDELESHRRHVYTGSIGYISFHDAMDLSIAIRTATIYNEKIFFSAGGGIVFDSDSYDEYDETLHKGRTLMEIFQGKEKRDCQQNYVWANGNIQVADQASIPISDLGFQYGYGFFETIRVNQNHPQYLDEHITRFYRTWQYLFFDDPPDLSWDEIIGRVIDKNDLIDKTAVVKIMASMGDREAPPFNHNLLVTARPYIHRLAEKREPGLNLATYPESRQTPLADHKTFNYLYYYLAGKWVQSQGADEALIINPDGTVSETNTANILLIKDKTVIKPVSNHVLPGIMQNVVCKLLAGWGLGIVDKEVRPKDLFKSDQIMITNSLIGVVPALRLDGEKLPNPSGLWQKVNDVVLNSA